MAILHDKGEAGGSQRDPAVDERPLLLLVDDDEMISDSLAFVLRDRFEVIVSDSRPATLSRLRTLGAVPKLALVDLGLPPSPHTPEEGFRLIEDLLQLEPAMKILVLSGQNTRPNVSHALSLGAVDFVSKPCDPRLLCARLEHQLMILDAEARPPEATSPVDPIIGVSVPVQRLREQIAQFAHTPFPVLIQGESGTGKELVAEALALAHAAPDADSDSAGTNRHSGSATPGFVTVNCAAIAPELLEAQLFGHARGSFTGAVSARPGFFEEAGEGTLFLDEIGEFPIELQPKLLRVLESGDYYRVGETRPRHTKARIIAATNRDLQTEIRAGRFRQDLYHRLSVLSIEVPPLRVREDDVLLLLDHFRGLYAQKMRPFVFDADAELRWRRYSFPGNIRELRNIVIRLGAKYPGAVVGIHQLEAELDSQSELDDSAIAELSAGGFSLDDTLHGWEQRYIQAALRLARGNLSEAARLLGVNRTTLYGKIQRLSLGEPTDV